MKKAMYLCPIGDKTKWTFYNKFTIHRQSHASKELFCSDIAGTLGGIMFYVAGVQAP